MDSPRHVFARTVPNCRPDEPQSDGPGDTDTEHLMRRYVIPVCGYVAVMMTIGEPALARERSHHHRHHWTLKHSHHSWRDHATSHHARHWRSSRRHVVWAQPYAPAVAQTIDAPFAWQ